MSSIATINRKITALNNKISKCEKEIKSYEKECAKYGFPGEKSYEHGCFQRNLQRIEKYNVEIASLQAEIERIQAGEQSIAGIVAILKAETVDMLESYLENTKVWAARAVESNIKTRERYTTLNQKYSGANWQEGRKDFTYRELCAWYAKTNIASFDVELFTNIMVERANQHYADSIAKLAYRLLGEGMKQDSLKVVYSRIGVNINCTITDGTKIATAQTVFASGPIQCPHYRFLVHVK